MVFDDFAEAEIPWRRLEAETHCHIFQTYDWLATWQRTVGDAAGVQPCLVWIGQGSGQGLMFMPLGIERRHGCRVLIWLGAPLADYRGPILAAGLDGLLADFAQSLWPTILKHLPKVDFVHLTSQPATIDQQSNPFCALAYRELPYRAHATRLQGTWEDYYRAKRSAKSRNTERRKEKKLRAEGDLSFKIAATPALTELMLENLFAQKSERLQSKGAADLFAVPGMVTFIRELTLGDSCRRHIHIAALQLDDRIIAVHWGAVYRDRFYFLLPALDVHELAHLSPGSLLINQLLEWSFAHDVKLFDFTIGDEPYKARWCEMHEPVFETLIPTSARGRAAVWLLRTDTYLRRLVRNQPWLYAVGSTIRRYRAKGSSKNKGAER